LWSPSLLAVSEAQQTSMAFAAFHQRAMPSVVGDSFWEISRFFPSISQWQSLERAII